MPSESDRDTLARIIYEAHPSSKRPYALPWEKVVYKKMHPASVDRQPFYSLADEILAAKWRHIGEDQTIISSHDALYLVAFLWNQTPYAHEVAVRIKAALLDQETTP